MLQAVIFDMDGTLIDSSPLWQQAEYTVFSDLGVTVDKQSTALTAGMTTKEVSHFWYQQQPWTGKRCQQVEQDVIDLVAHLIKTQGKPLPGVNYLLHHLYQQDLPIALATNSPRSLVDVVLNTLNIQDIFQTISTIDDVSLGKPNPEIYHAALAQLSTSPQQTIAVEDSITGLTAAQRANLKTILVVPKSQQHKMECHSADLTIDTLHQLNYTSLRELMT